jgi:hypothetical protein
MVWLKSAMGKRLARSKRDFCSKNTNFENNNSEMSKARKSTVTM